MKILPIFVIVFPKDFPNYNAKDVLSDLNQRLSNDYYVIAVRGNKDEFEFKGFYPKDFDEVKFQEFKEEVVKTLKK